MVGELAAGDIVLRMTNIVFKMSEKLAGTELSETKITVDTHDPKFGISSSLIDSHGKEAIGQQTFVCLADNTVLAEMKVYICRICLCLWRVPVIIVDVRLAKAAAGEPAIQEDSIRCLLEC